MLATEEMITATYYLNHYKVAVITSLVDKISLFVTKISFVVDGMIFKVAVMAS